MRPSLSASQYFHANSSAFLVAGQMLRSHSSSPEINHSRYTWMTVPICPSAAGWKPSVPFVPSGSGIRKHTKPSSSIEFAHSASRIERCNCGKR